MTMGLNPVGSQFGMGQGAASSQQAGIDIEIRKRFRPCSAAAIGSLVAWLADNQPGAEWDVEGVLRGPAMAKSLGLLDAPSLLREDAGRTEERAP